MAKNNTPQDPYVRQQAAIRKAKGNPNKNVHHKKNNSKKPERIKMPLWMKIFLGVLFAMLATALVLRMTVLKDNLLMNYVTSLLLGLACAALFYTRQYNSAKKESKLYGVVCVILAIMAIIYGGMGLLGILSYLGVF